MEERDRLIEAGTCQGPVRPVRDLSDLHTCGTWCSFCCLLEVALGPWDWEGKNAFG